MNLKREVSASKISKKELNVKLKKIYKESNFEGFAVGIVKNDSVYFSKGYGWANAKDKVPFTEKTIMPIASVSKTFIAFAVVKAIELGYFTAETPINEILPYPVINPNFPDDIITVKHLFTHTSGIIDVDEIYHGTYQPTKRPDVAMDVFLNDYLNASGELYSKSNFDIFEAGKKYNYSNIGSVLMAYLIEIKSELSFDAFTQKFLFEPLKLKNTHWFYNEKKAKKYATLYEIYPQDKPKHIEYINPDRTIKTYSCITYPDGSLRSTVKDLSAYVIEIITGYQNKSDLLKDENYQLLFQKRFSEGAFPANFEEAENQAIFWEYKQSHSISHGGNDLGATAFLSIDLKNKIGRIIFINCSILNGKRLDLINSYAKILEVLNEVQ